MSANARIKADTVDNLLSVQPLHLCIGIQFIEIADAQSQISISKQLNCFSLSESHEQRINVFLDCTFLKQLSKNMCSLHQTGVFYIRANDDTARIQVVIQCLALTQELRAEDNVIAVIFFTDACSEANGNRRFDYHDCFRVILNYQFDNSFNRRSIKKIFLTVIVGRSRNDHKIRIRICFLCVQRCGQIQFFFCQILFNILVLNRRLLVVDQFHLFGNDIHRSHLMVLTQQRCNGKSNVASSGYSNFQILKISHDYFLLSLCVFILKTHSLHTHSC